MSTDAACPAERFQHRIIELHSMETGLSVEFDPADHVGILGSSHLAMPP